MITHPDVVMDAEVPVPRWPLSARGLARMRSGLAQPWLANIEAIYSSDEQKALDGAHVLREALGRPVNVRAELGENDRSATGYLPSHEFNETADQFFAEPSHSIRGWETASAAQTRIRRAIDDVRSDGPAGDVAVVSHGGVSTLLLCHLLGVPISRAHDQPREAVGGFYYAFDSATHALAHDWRRFDVLDGEPRLDAERRRFAEEVRIRGEVRTEALVRAFATVPREAFFGPGPWRILGQGGYESTPGDDPALLYENVLIAIDERRLLNNGEPAGLARWFDRLELRPGGRVVHIGTGVGYYTAILAETVGSTGAVLGVELDAALAERARENTERWPQVRIENRDGTASTLPAESTDALFVNAGATHPMPAWLDTLALGGRLVLPLTTSDRLDGIGLGYMLCVERREDGYAADFFGPVGVYPCLGARTERGSRALRRAFDAGGHEAIRRLVREPHTEGPACWLHGEGFCLQP